jgi:heme-degrading monooxygenase HmoA
VIEIQTFRLAAGTSEDQFLAADRAVQTEVVPNQPGFARRTTARGDGGEWVVVTLWWTDADASAAATLEHPALDAFAVAIDPATLVVRRFEELPG